MSLRTCSNRTTQRILPPEQRLLSIFNRFERPRAEQPVQVSRLAIGVGGGDGVVLDCLEGALQLGLRRDCGTSPCRVLKQQQRDAGGQ